MSGFYGFINRDGEQASKEIADTMLDAISYWQPDGKDIWINEQVALGHTMLWNTPESKFEKLPNKQSHTIITMDGRLHNRDELAEQLDVSSLSAKRITDSDFILKSYFKWGEQCPCYLLGDFAFVIWDEIEEKLFCARDHAGVKQFYYHLTDKLFVFANDLKGLVKHPDITRTISTESVASYIINRQLISPTLTFFENIKKLPPAHTLSISSSHIEKKCFWKPEDAPEIKLPTLDNYTKKLRQPLEEAVHCRIRSSYPITSHLSGGLDSSAIAVIAARKLKIKNKNLLAFNWLHEPETGDDSTYYEWSNSKSIAEAEGIEHHYLALDARDIYRHINHHEIAYGATTVFWYEYPVRQAAKKRDSRTILSGWGGDELATYHGQSYYSEMFIKGKIWRLLHELKARVGGKNKGLKSMLSAIYHKVFIPMVPRSMYCQMPKITCKRPSFPFVKKEFMAEINKELKKTSPLTMQPQKTIRAHMLAYWQNAHIQSRIESWAADAVIDRLEYTYPLLDKRIIEFVLGTPAECFVRNGAGRHLFRSVVRGLLSEKIIWSDAKMEPKRIKRLVSLLLYSSKEIVENELYKIRPSSFVNREELIGFLKNIDSTMPDKTSIETIAQVEASLLLILSGRID